MTTLNIDLTALSNDHLLAMRAVAPVEVARELERRQAFDSYNEAFNELAFATATLEHLVASNRETKVVRELRGLGIIETMRRVLGTALEKGDGYETPDADRVWEAIRKADAGRAGGETGDQ